MWNLSTSADIMLQISLIARDRFRSLDFSPFAYVPPAYLLVIIPSQQFYYSSTLQEGWSNLLSNENILKWLAVFLLLELNSILLLSKNYSARLVKRCEWAKLSCNRWFVLMFASICIINSLFLTLVIWGRVDDSVRQLFNKSELSGHITSVLIRSLLNFTALTRLFRQLMEGFLFIVDKADRKSRWYNSKRVCHGLFPSITFFIQTFLITFTFIHQHNLNWFIIVFALIMDICFRITLSSWILKNSYSSTIRKMYIRRYLMWYHSALWQTRSLLKSCIVGIISAYWVIFFHCIGVLLFVLMERRAVEPLPQFEYPVLQRDQEVPALQARPEEIDQLNVPVQLENAPHEKFEFVSGVHPQYHGLLLQTLQPHYFGRGSLIMSLPTFNLPLQTLHSGCFEEPNDGFLEDCYLYSTPFSIVDQRSQKPDGSVSYEDIYMHLITFNHKPLQETIRVHKLQESPVFFEQSRQESGYQTDEKVPEIPALSEAVEQLTVSEDPTEVFQKATQVSEYQTDEKMPEILALSDLEDLTDEIDEDMPEIWTLSELLTAKAITLASTFPLPVIKRLQERDPENETSDHGPVQPKAVSHEKFPHHHDLPWQALHGSSFEKPHGGFPKNYIPFFTTDQWSPEPDNGALHEDMHMLSATFNPEPLQEIAHVHKSQKHLVPGILYTNKTAMPHGRSGLVV